MILRDGRTILGVRLKGGPLAGEVAKLDLSQPYGLGLSAIYGVKKVMRKDISDTSASLFFILEGDCTATYTLEVIGQNDEYPEGEILIVWDPKQKVNHEKS